MKKNVLIAITLILSQKAFSNQAQTGGPGRSAAPEKVLEMQIESPAALELGLDTQLIRGKDNSINGAGNALGLSFSYGINESHTLNLNSEISYQKVKEEEGESNWELIEIGYSKDFSANLLNTSITSSLYYQYSINEDTRDEEKQNGSIYLLLESESEISSNLSFEGEIQLTQFFNTSDDEEVIKRNFNLQINPIFSVSESLAIKFPINSSFEFNRGSNGDGFLNTTITPTIGYSLTSNLEFETYAEFTPINSHDGRTIASNFDNERTYGFTISYGIL